MTGTITPSGVGTAIFYPTQVSAGAGVGDAINKLPGNTNAPVFYEPGPVLTDGAAVLWIVATGGVDWGGCTVWMSVDGGSSYGQVGAIIKGGIQGLLTNTLPSGSDPDITNTLSVDLTMSQATLLSGTMSDADLDIMLCYVDGELISYETATLTSAFHYNLTYLRRGVYSSPVGSHAPGSQFARFNQTTFRQGYPANLVGTTIHVKFPSFNTFGSQAQELSDVTVYTYTLTGNGLAPGGTAGTCPVDAALAAGVATFDWGILGAPVSSSCDWGRLGETVLLQIDMGRLGD